MATPLLNVAPALGVPFTTTDATPTTIARFDAAQYPLDAFWLEAKVLAVYADGSKCAAYWLVGLFRSAAAGTITQVGATASVISAIEDTGSMDCALAVTGTKVDVVGTGVAATSINWLVDSTIRHAPFSK